MNYLFLGAGAVLSVLVIADIIKTVFSTRGAGSLSSATIWLVWTPFFAAAKKRGGSKLLEYAGPSMLVSILGVWIIGLWLGFFLLLMADTGSVVSSSTESPTTPLEKLYYAGFTVATLGVGDYKASADVWRLLTDIAAFAGLAFITTAITYFVQVLSAVTVQNKLSLYVNSMGPTPQDILINSWTGETFDPFYSHVANLNEMLIEHITNHHSFPVIHYFHASDPEMAVIPAIVRLDETCHLLLGAETSGSHERQLALHMLRETLDQYVKMVESGFMSTMRPSSSPPTPDLAPLARQGITINLAKAMKSGSRRREIMTALLERDGWSWKDVYR